MATDFPELLVVDAGDWNAWLERHHDSSPGVRLILSRKGGAVTALFYDDALDEALCFGWIDAQAGRAAVDAAKADGRWERAYAGPAIAEAPADLMQAITAVPKALAMYDVLTSQNRFALYFRLSQLKTAAARERKIADFVGKLARHELPYPQKKMP